MTESSSALRFFTCDPTYRRFDACSLWNTGLQHNQSTCLAERGHSCPQQLPNASVGRFVARSPQSPSLRTGMSALRAKRVLALGTKTGSGGRWTRVPDKSTSRDYHPSLEKEFFLPA